MKVAIVTDKNTKHIPNLERMGYNIIAVSRVGNEMVMGGYVSDKTSEFTLDTILKESKINKTDLDIVCVGINSFTLLRRLVKRSTNYVAYIDETRRGTDIRNIKVIEGLNNVVLDPANKTYHLDNKVA